jgi:hypothetical protein
MSRLVKGADLINQFGRNLPTPVIDTIRLTDLSPGDQIYEELESLTLDSGGLEGIRRRASSDSSTVTRIDVEISVLMNTWDGFKAEELSRELFQTITSNDSTDNESLYINVYVSKSTGTTNELKSSRLNLKGILTPPENMLQSTLLNNDNYSATNYQTMIHALSLIGESNHYVVSVPLSDFYDTVEMTAVFDEDNNPILRMSAISVPTYIKDFIGIEHLTYFATISVGNPATIGTTPTTPNIARLSAAAYALNFSDVSYEDVIRDGTIAVYGEPAFLDEQGIYYPSVPLRALNLKYYKTENYNRDDIFNSIDSLLGEYSQYLSTDTDLKNAVEGILYIMSAYGDESDFINRLNRTGQIFAVTQDVTRTSRLYERYRILVNNIDARIKAEPEVVKRVLRNYKIIDARSFVLGDFEARSFVTGLISSDFLYNRVFHTNVANYVPIANQESTYPGTAELPVTPSTYVTEFNEMLNQRKTQLQTLLDAGRSARVYGVEDIEEDSAQSYYEEAVDTITDWIHNTWARRFVGGHGLDVTTLEEPTWFNQGGSSGTDGVKIIIPSEYYGITQGKDSGDWAPEPVYRLFEELFDFTDGSAAGCRELFGYTPTEYSPGGNYYMKVPDGPMVSYTDDTYYQVNQFFYNDLFAQAASHEEFLGIHELSRNDKQIRAYVPRRKFPGGGSSTNPETAPDTAYADTHPDGGGIHTSDTGDETDEGAIIGYNIGQSLKDSYLDYVGSFSPIVFSNFGVATGESYYTGGKAATEITDPSTHVMIYRRKELDTKSQVKAFIQRLFGLNDDLVPIADSDTSTSARTTIDSYLGQMNSVVARDVASKIVNLVSVIPAAALNSEAERQAIAEGLTIQAFGKLDETLNDYLNNDLCRIMLGTAAIQADAGKSLKEGKSIVKTKFYRRSPTETPMVFGDWELPADCKDSPGQENRSDRFIYEFGSDIADNIRQTLLRRRAAIKEKIVDMLWLQGYYSGISTDVGIHSALAETDIVLKKYGYFFFDMEKYIRKQSVISQILNVDRLLAYMPLAKEMTNNAINFSKVRYINHNFGANGIQLSLKKDLNSTQATKATSFENMRFKTPLNSDGVPYIYSKVNTLSNITFDQITEYTNNRLTTSGMSYSEAGVALSSPVLADVDFTGATITTYDPDAETGGTTATSTGATTADTAPPGEVDMAALLSDPIYQPVDQHTMIVARNYAFPGFNDNTLYAGKTWRDDYRLMCFHYQMFMDDDNAFVNPFFQPAPYSNDAVTLEVTVVDKSHKIVKALYDHYVKIFEDFEEYYNLAIEGCAYNNYDFKFNDFFTEEMLVRFPDPRSSPWFRMVAIYTLYINIFTNTYKGDKARMEQSANSIIESIRPETGTLRYLLDFFQQVEALHEQLNDAYVRTYEIVGAAERGDIGSQIRIFTIHKIISEVVIDHIGDYTERADTMGIFRDD